jgi:hypothetical protein
VRPRQNPGLEGVGQRRQRLEPRGDAGQLLHLAGAESEPFARVVTQTGEAEALVAAPAQERGGELADDAAAHALLSSEPPEPPVEQGRARPAVDPACLGARGDLEQFRGHEGGLLPRSLMRNGTGHEAKNRRNKRRCQVFSSY